MGRSRVMNLFCLQVRSMRFFRGRKNAEITVRTVNMNPCLPLGGSFVPTHANVTALVALVFALLIVNVLLMGHYSEVLYAVVMAHPIYVVYVALRKLTINHSPNEPMRFVHLLAVPNLDIPIGVKAGHRVAIAIPNQRSGFWTVCKRLPQQLKIKIVHIAS